MWYEDPAIDIGIWWWAVEHRGHPAFYLRALMAGDFAPGQSVHERHVLLLDGKAPNASGKIRCGTCNKEPDADDLVPIERATGNAHAIDVFRTRRKRWPKKTDPTSCWLCGLKYARPRPAKPKRREVDFEPVDKLEPSDVEPSDTQVRGRHVPLCRNCNRHVADRKGTDKWLG